MNENSPLSHRRFPLTLDNTQLLTARSCKRKFYFEYCLGLSLPGGESIDLIAGKAFAAGCEATRDAFYLLGKNELTSISEGINKLVLTYGDREAPDHKAHKSLSRVLDAFLSYFGLETQASKCTTLGVHRLGEDPYRPIQFADFSGVEFSMSIDTGLKHPDGYDLPFHGRFDALCESPIGLVGLDEKTGSSLDKNWSSKWGLRSQFLNYMHIAREFGYELSGFVTRGIIFQKTQFHFPEAFITPSEAVINQSWDSTIYEAQLILSHWEQDYFPGAFNDECNAYGGCPFRTICESGGDPEPWANQFDIAFWDPVRGEREIIHSVENQGEIDNPFEEF